MWALPWANSYFSLPPFLHHLFLGTKGEWKTHWMSISLWKALEKGTWTQIRRGWGGGPGWGQVWFWWGRSTAPSEFQLPVVMMSQGLSSPEFSREAGNCGRWGFRHLQTSPDFFFNVGNNLVFENYLGYIYRQYWVHGSLMKPLLW